MSASSSPFDASEFRKALGAFATGVTIITTRSNDGAAVGLTVNSFNSVSLNPPLVLWSLANNSLSLDAFKTSTHWAVHVLASDQEDLSGRFARRGEDKFSGIQTEAGAGDVPLLTGCLARFECRTAFQYEGGDHVIFVGEVVAFDRKDVAPLVFHGGKYAHATQRNANKPRSAYLSGSFTEDFLGYLLGRSHFQFFGQIRHCLQEEALDDEEFYVLSTLTLKHAMSSEEMDAGMEGVLVHKPEVAIARLLERGLVQHSIHDHDYELTPEGSASALRVISAAKAVESQLLERLGANDATILKSLLNRLLGTLDPGADALWDRVSA